MDRDDVLEWEQLANRVGEDVVRRGPGVRLVTVLDRRPLVPAHGTGARVGQQVDQDMLGAHLEEVEGGFSEIPATLGAGAHPQRLHRMDPERLEDRAEGGLVHAAHRRVVRPRAEGMRGGPPSALRLCAVVAHRPGISGLARSSKSASPAGRSPSRSCANGCAFSMSNEIGRRRALQIGSLGLRRGGSDRRSGNLAMGRRTGVRLAAVQPRQSSSVRCGPGEGIPPGCPFGGMPRRMRTNVSPQ